MESQKNLLDDYLSAIGEFPLLTRKEEQKLFAQLAQAKKEGNQQEYQRIRNQIVVPNLRFVVYTAKQFRSWGEMKGHIFSDLISAGNFGLFYAVDTFDPSRGTKLTTYASSHIQKAVRKYIKGNGRIKKTAWYHEFLRQYNSLKSELDSLSHEEQEEEIALRLSIPVELLRKRLSNEHFVFSLEELAISEEGEMYIQERVDGACIDPQEQVIKLEQLKNLDRALVRLDERERKIVELRYGLTNEKQYNLKQIGEKIGVSRERVRQLQAKALRKMRRFV